MGYAKRIVAAALMLVLMVCLWGGPQTAGAQQAIMPRASGDIDVPFDPPTLSVRKISVSTQSVKKEYLKGESLDLTGLVVRATRSDSSTVVIKNYSVSGYSANTLGTQTITVSYSGKTANFQVTVYAPGDANGDGAVDGKDATLLLQHAAGWNVQIKSRPADANGDGAVDGKDATLLLQYAAGWNVKLGK